MRNSTRRVCCSLLPWETLNTTSSLVEDLSNSKANQIFMALLDLETEDLTTLLSALEELECLSGLPLPLSLSVLRHKILRLVPELSLMSENVPSSYGENLPVR